MNEVLREHTEGIYERLESLENESLNWENDQHGDRDRRQFGILFLCLWCLRNYILFDFQDNFLLRRKGQGENGQSVGSAMFLATVYDKESEAWTGLSPSGMVSCPLNL